MSLILPHCDTAVFQIFLDAMAAEVPKCRGKRVLRVLGNASRHKTKSLYLAAYFTKQSKDLSEQLVELIQHLMDQPKIIRSVYNTHSE